MIKNLTPQQILEIQSTINTFTKIEKEDLPKCRKAIQYYTNQLPLYHSLDKINSIQEQIKYAKQDENSYIDDLSKHKQSLLKMGLTLQNLSSKILETNKILESAKYHHGTSSKKYTQINYEYKYLSRAFNILNSNYQTPLEILQQKRNNLSQHVEKLDNTQEINICKKHIEKITNKILKYL